MATSEIPRNHIVGGRGLVEHSLRRGVQLAADRKLDVSPSKLSRAIRAYVRKFEREMTNTEMLEQYFLAHVDPVGESAIRNVMAKEKALNLNGVTAPNVQTRASKPNPTITQEKDQ